jgi:hypothetical protein
LYMLLNFDPVIPLMTLGRLCGMYIAS